MSFSIEFLTKNSIATMNGPLFLAVYIVFIIVIYLIGDIIYSITKSNYPQSSVTIINTPEPDPYILSYIRAGVMETYRLLICNLLIRGYFESNYIIKNVKQKIEHPPVENLSKIEALVFNQYSQDWETKNNSDKSNALIPIKIICDEAIIKNNMEAFLFPEADIKKINFIVLGMRLAIFCFGGYKLSIALLNGHYNILFLLFLMMFGIYMAKHTIKIERMSKSGEKYISELKAIYKSKFSNGLKGNPITTQMLLGGIFGSKIFTEIGFGNYVNFSKIEKSIYKNEVNNDSLSNASGSGCSNVSYIGSCGGGGSSSCGTAGSNNCGGGASCGGGCGGGCGGCGS